MAHFGLAKCWAESGGSITQRGELAGTLLYIAPEQILDFKNVKASADVYSMGVTLYYLLSAEYPFDFPTKREQVSLRATTVVDGTSSCVLLKWTAGIFQRGHMI